MWDSINKYRKVQQRRGLLLLAGLVIMIITTVPVVVLFQEEAAPPACCYRASIVVCASDNCGACGCDYTCDGTDDEAEINDAIAELVTCATGGDVMLTEGTFTLGDSIVLEDDITLRGSGRGTKIEWAENSDTFIAITNADAGSGTDTGMVVRDLMLDGDDKGYGIYFEDAFDSTVENVWVTDAKYGIYFDDVDRSNVLTSWIYSGYDGFSALNCNAVGLNGCYIYSNTNQGGYFSASVNCALEGNQVYSNTSYGLFFTNGSDHASLVRNIVHENTGSGINITSSSFCELSNNEAYLNGGDGIQLYAVMMQPACTANQIVSNTLYQNNQGGAGASNYSQSNLFGTMVGNAVLANHSYADTSTANSPAYCIYVGGGTNNMVHGNLAHNRATPAQDMSISAGKVGDNTGVDAVLAVEWLAETLSGGSPTQNYKIWTMDGVVYFYSQYIDVPFNSPEDITRFLEAVMYNSYHWEMDWTPGLEEKSIRIAVPDYWMPLATFLKDLSEATGISPKDLTKNMGNYIKPSDAAWRTAGLRVNVGELNGRVGATAYAYYYLEHPDKYPYTTQDIKDYIDMTGWKSMEVAP